MEDNKVFELNDKALDNIGGGYADPNDFEYKGLIERHYYSCHQQREMSLYINHGTGENIMICTECGEKYNNMY